MDLSHAVIASVGEGVPQGLKPISIGPDMRPKAEALGCLEASAEADSQKE